MRNIVREIKDQKADIDIMVADHKKRIAQEHEEFNKRIKEINDEYKSELGELEDTHHTYKSSVGILQLDKIYETCIKSVYSKSYASDKHRLEKEKLTQPFITMSVNGNTYDIIFDFVHDYRIGEFMYIDELSQLLTLDEYTLLVSDMDNLESMFMANTQTMYSKLSSTRKKTHVELKRVIKSKKQPYIYFYTGKEYRKYLMGFIVLRRPIDSVDVSKNSIHD